MEENSENVDESDPHSIEGSIKEDVSVKEEGDNNGFIGEIAEISEEKENKNGSFTCKYEWIYLYTVRKCLSRLQRCCRLFHFWSDQSILKR